MANTENRKDDKGRKLKDGERLRSDGRYEYRYIEPVTGKRKGIYERDLSMLRQKERELQRKLEGGVLTTNDLHGASLNSWFEEYMQIVQIEDSTRQNYMSAWNFHVRNTIGKMKLVDIRPTQIKTLYGDMTKKGYSWSTIKVVHCMLCPIFDMALDDDVIIRNPASNQLSGFGRKPKARDALTSEQQARLFDFVEKSPTYRQHLPMLQIMVGTACRVGELAGLTWDDVDHKAKELNIDHQLIYKNYGDGCKFHVSSPKTDSGIRTIPLTDTVCHALTEQKKYQFILGIDHSIEVDGLKISCSPQRAVCHWLRTQ